MTEMYSLWGLQVVTLVMRMEVLRGGGRPLPPPVRDTLAHWMEGISALQRCRCEEIVNAANRQFSPNPQQQKDKGKFCSNYPQQQKEKG